MCCYYHDFHVKSTMIIKDGSLWTLGSYKRPLSSEKQPSINCRFQPDIEADYFVITVKKSKKTFEEVIYLKFL